MSLSHISGPLLSEGGFIGGSGAFGAPAGKVFFVNVNTGSAARNFDRPWYDVNGDTVFATLQAAIDQCVSDRGDVIYYARGYTTVTAPVLFNKAGISVIVQGYGQNPLSGGEYVTIDADAGYTTGPVGIISQPCRIVGLGFNSLNAGALQGALRIHWDTVSGDQGGWVHLLGCRFPNWGNVARYGLDLHGATQCLIEACDFEAQSTALTAGIMLRGSAGNHAIRNEIRGNRFKNCTYAVDFVNGTPSETQIIGNYISGGKRLNSRGLTATGSLVADNYVGQFATGNTCDDAVTGTLNGQGIWFAGNHYGEGI